MIQIVYTKYRSKEIHITLGMWTEEIQRLEILLIEVWFILLYNKNAERRYEL